MADLFSKEQRALVMSRIRGRGNQTTEMRLVRLFRAEKVTGWRRHVKLPGRPDFIFRAARVAIFVDGDFWHANPRKYRLPKSNTDFWAEKARRNRARDRRVNRELRARGWRVLRVWESTLQKQPERVLGRILKSIGAPRPEAVTGVTPQRPVRLVKERSTPNGK